jgi:hypothetical protein
MSAIAACVGVCLQANTHGGFGDARFAGKPAPTQIHQRRSLAVE